MHELELQNASAVCRSCYKQRRFCEAERKRFSGGFVVWMRERSKQNNINIVDSVHFPVGDRALT